MKGGHNRLPGEREAARRMWDGGLPRKTIATLLNVSYHTVSKWRWQDGWGNRRRYEKRPINQARTVYHKDESGEKVSVEPGVVRFACPGCGMRSESVKGHGRCQEAA